MLHPILTFVVLTALFAAGVYGVFRTVTGGRHR